MSKSTGLDPKTVAAGENPAAAKSASPATGPRDMLVAHFHFSEAKAVATGLTVRPPRRFMARAGFALPRCALF